MSDNEEQINIKEENKLENTEINKKNNFSIKWIIIIILVILFIALLCVLLYFNFNKSSDANKNNPDKESNIKTDEVPVDNSSLREEYHMSGNSLENFDLSFLKFENDGEDFVYSPISIKYVLQVLYEISNGESKTQIGEILGDYTINKYTNSNNVSFANAIFINDLYKNKVNNEYLTNLKNNYNTEAIYDSFSNATNINKWVSNKTFNLINNFLSDDEVVGYDFQVINALAINMEWVNKIQSLSIRGYKANYKHEKYSLYISQYDDNVSSEFNNKKVKSTIIGASINKYDIVSDKGEDNIREYVGQLYQEWLDEGTCSDIQLSKDEYLDQYIKELNSNYKQISSSTDFGFYTDENVKVFQKDLKEYNGTTLQYIGIMPEKVSLSDYIDSITKDDINTIISSIKQVEYDNFEDNVITKIYGTIPLFNTTSELKLIEDLKKIGITEIFTDNADFTNLCSELTSTNISNFKQKSNIEFSNDGIKASSATVAGGAGTANCEFEYLYDVPVVEIDLTFDKPYMYIIRDKDTGEVWFVGTVYNPTETK